MFIDGSLLSRVGNEKFFKEEYELENFGSQGP